MRKKNLSKTKSTTSYILQGLLKINREKNKNINTVVNYCCLSMSKRSWITEMIVITCDINTFKKIQLKILYFLTRENLMKIQAGNDEQMKEL